LLQAADGQELPVVYDIPVNGPEDPKIEGLVFLRDVLGNKTKVNIENLHLLALQDITDDNEKTTKAADDTDDDKAAEDSDEQTDDSWAWLTRF
jgi:hypothetical protein